MSYEARIIVDSIVDDACELFGLAEDDEHTEEFKFKLTNRIQSFESELISQTKNHIIEAVKSASV